MLSYSVEFHNVETLYDFFQLIDQKKQVYYFTGSSAEFHFRTELPFIRTANLSCMTEDEHGVQMIVVIEFGKIFLEEGRCKEFVHRDWFFSTFRRMQQRGELSKVLDYFYNSLEGDIKRLVPAMTRLKHQLQNLQMEVNAKADRLTLASEEYDTVNESLHGSVTRYVEVNRRLLWCKMIHVLGEYLNYVRE